MDNAAAVAITTMCESMRNGGLQGLTESTVIDLSGRIDDFVTMLTSWVAPDDKEAFATQAKDIAELLVTLASICGMEKTTAALTAHLNEAIGNDNG